MKGVFQAYGLTWGDSPQTPIDIFLQTIATQSFVKKRPETLTVSSLSSRLIMT